MSGAQEQHPIGIFDSGYGGLTVMREIVKALPQYDYVYLGDNARTPYGTRSFDTVYEFTRECVWKLFDMGCRLVIVACNTSSAKALRTIQQKDLISLQADHRVLGVIRPTTERIGSITKSGHVGILGTNGTVQSRSYPVEIAKFFPDVKVYQQACPMWVPLVENNEIDNAGAEYFVKEYLNELMSQSDKIDTLVLGCTHYPLLEKLIRKHLKPGVELISQGPLIADRLQDYLLRHPDLEKMCARHGARAFYTTDDVELFEEKAQLFLGEPVKANYLHL